MNQSFIDIAKVVGIIALCVTVASAALSLKKSIDEKFDAVLAEMKTMNEFIMRHDEKIRTNERDIDRLGQRLNIEEERDRKR